MELFVHKKFLWYFSPSLLCLQDKLLKNALTGNTNKPISYQWRCARTQRGNEAKDERKERPSDMNLTHIQLHTHTRSFHFRFACQCHTQQHTSDHINIADVRVVPCVQACVYVCVCSSPVSRNLNISFSNRPFLLLFCILSFGFFLFFRHSEKVAPRKYT